MERSDPSVELAEALAGIARALQHERSVGDTLQQVVTETIRLVDGCEHAALDRVVAAEIVPVVASSEVAGDIDRIQAETGQGPCIDVLRHHETFKTGDLAEEARWPAFARRAHEETGVRSMMGFRLWAEEETLGTLSLYSTRRDAFDDRAEAVGAVLAAHAAIAWTMARRQEQMEDALRTRDLIGQAKGMLMIRHRVGEEEAFALLREVSQQANVKLRDVAARLVDDPESMGR